MFVWHVCISVFETGEMRQPYRVASLSTTANLERNRSGWSLPPSLILYIVLHQLLVWTFNIQHFRLGKNGKNSYHYLHLGNSPWLHLSVFGKQEKQVGLDLSLSRFMSLVLTLAHAQSSLHARCGAVHAAPRSCPCTCWMDEWTTSR